MNILLSWNMELIGPFIAMNLAGFVQFIVLYPIQKFVLLRERKEEVKAEEVNDK